jgi:hypothetical protein
VLSKPFFVVVGAQIPKAIETVSGSDSDRQKTSPIFSGSQSNNKNGPFHQASTKETKSSRKEVIGVTL